MRHCARVSWSCCVHANVRMPNIVTLMFQTPRCVCRMGSDMMYRVELQLDEARRAAAEADVAAGAAQIAARAAFQAAVGKDMQATAAWRDVAAAQQHLMDAEAQLSVVDQELASLRERTADAMQGVAELRRSIVETSDVLQSVTGLLSAPTRCVYLILRDNIISPVLALAPRASQPRSGQHATSICFVVTEAHRLG